MKRLTWPSCQTTSTSLAQLSSLHLVGQLDEDPNLALGLVLVDPLARVPAILPLEPPKSPVVPFQLQATEA
jgi:hypothetical protein